MKKLVNDRISDMTNFEKTVLFKTLEIPRGKVTTYKRISQKIGKPKAYRAVANALHKNPIPPIIPCHRVVRSDGFIVGKNDSVKSRKHLLEQEGIPIENSRVKLNQEILF